MGRSNDLEGRGGWIWGAEMASEKHNTPNCIQLSDITIFYICLDQLKCINMIIFKTSKKYGDTENLTVWSDRYCKSSQDRQHHD